MFLSNLQGISSLELLAPWCLLVDTILGFTIPMADMFMFMGSISLSWPLLEVKSSGLKSSLVNETELWPLTSTVFCMSIGLFCMLEGLCRNVVEST